MAEQENVLQPTIKESHGGLMSYIVGFISSIVLTIVAFMLVMSHALSSVWTITIIVALAVIQVLVQLFFFLHLGRESKPRWNLYILLSALMVIGIIVGGSLWIMNNLDSYMQMTPVQEAKYMHDNEGL
jgi:cytochrome o ubiquinol oxidase operon protein cyoD